MKRSFSIVVFFVLLLAACNSNSASETINVELMDDNAQLVTIAGKTKVSDLIEEDRVFLDEFLEKHYNNKETFDSYNKKEQAIVLEAVETIQKIKEREN